MSDSAEEPSQRDIPFLENLISLQNEQISRLKEQLKSFQISKNDSFATGGEPDSCVIPAFVDADAVLNNHINLANIFKHLDFDGLKTARLICSAWSTLALASTPFRLCIRKMFPCCDIAPVPQICPALAKSIYFHNHCYQEESQHDPEVTIETSSNNFLSFCSQHHSTVEQVYLQVEMSFSTTFVEVMSSLQFPNLRKIEVLLDDENIDFPAEIPSFGIKKQLRRIEVITMHPSFEDYPFINIFQKLIESAPNLEELCITDNFFPELESCTKLQCLELSPTPYEQTGSDFNYADDVPEEENTFSMSNISRMLEQTKHSLKKLVLSTQSPHLHADDHRHSQVGLFQFPKVMANLEILENYAIEQFPLGDFMQSDRFPSLKKLVLREQQGPDALEEFLRGLGDRNAMFQSVTGLDFGGIRNPRSDIPIQVFPNVSDVHVQLPRLKMGEDERDKKELLKEFFQAVSRWPLKKLRVQIEFRYTWSELATGLRHLKPVRNGLEYLKIVNLDSYGVQDNFILNWENHENYVGKFEEILAQSKGMQAMIFQSFSMKTATATRIFRFIARKNLPVHFPE